MLPKVVLYSRPGCHLCDEARDVVLAERAADAFDLEEIDIETDDALLRDYGIAHPGGHDRWRRGVRVHRRCQAHSPISFEPETQHRGPTIACDLVNETRPELG